MAPTSDRATTHHANCFPIRISETNSPVSVEVMVSVASLPSSTLSNNFCARST